MNIIFIGNGYIQSEEWEEKVYLRMVNFILESLWHEWFPKGSLLIV